MKFSIGSSPACLQVSRPSGHSKAGDFSLRGIRDQVVLLRAAALEGVVEPEPVTDLVCTGVSQAVDRVVATGHRVGQDDDAVIARLRCVRLRERRPTQ